MHLFGINKIIHLFRTSITFEPHVCNIFLWPTKNFMMQVFEMQNLFHMIFRMFSKFISWAQKLCACL